MLKGQTFRIGLWNLRVMMLWHLEGATPELLHIISSGFFLQFLRWLNMIYPEKLQTIT